MNLVEKGYSFDQRSLFSGKLYPEVLVPFGVNGEFVVVREQGLRRDKCGQTCMDMLGYDGNAFAPKGRLWNYQLFNVIDVKTDRFILDGNDTEMTYDSPHMVIMRPKNEGNKKDSVNCEDGHWVIRVDEKVICPKVGVMNVQEYQEKYGLVPHEAYRVKFKQQFLYEKSGTTQPLQQVGTNGLRRKLADRNFRFNKASCIHSSDKRCSGCS